MSTMMYLMALQDNTSCPFRVVDEINQVYIYLFKHVDSVGMCICRVWTQPMNVECSI